MNQENQNSEHVKRKNTVALIWMICSIIWLLFFISIIGIKLWIIFLTIWLILGIIWLFYKPRTKARIAIIIPIIAIIIFVIWYNYVKNSTPAAEFSAWFEDISENELYSDIIKDDNFLKSTSNDFYETISTKKWNELKELYDKSFWSNAFEKWIYVFFELKKESIENNLEKYLTNLQDSTIEIVDEEDENIEEKEIDEENIDEETEIDEEEIDKDDKTDLEDNDKKDNDKNKDSKKEEAKEAKKEKTETIEIFDNWEKDDIEEIINILE